MHFGVSNSNRCDNISIFLYIYLPTSTPMSQNKQQLKLHQWFQSYIMYSGGQKWSDWKFLHINLSPYIVESYFCHLMKRMRFENLWSYKDTSIKCSTLLDIIFLALPSFSCNHSSVLMSFPFQGITYCKMPPHNSYVFANGTWKYFILFIFFMWNDFQGKAGETFLCPWTIKLVLKCSVINFLQYTYSTCILLVLRLLARYCHFTFIHSTFLFRKN